MIVAGPSYVVDHLVVAPLVERARDPAAEVAEHVLPAHLLELPRTPRSGPLERNEDALGVADLVERRRAFRARATAAPRMHRVALELYDLALLTVDEREEPAGGLAVEADRRNALVVTFDPLGPGARIELDPVVPVLGRRSDLELPRGSPRPNVSLVLPVVRHRFRPCVN